MTDERTLALVKPDATSRPIVGAILAMAEEAGLRVADARMLRPDRALMEALYVEHQDREWFSDHIEYMLSGSILALVLEGEDAIARWRSVMGATDREKALPGTVRHRFAQSYRRNSVHGSDSPASAAREIALVFGDTDRRRGLS